MRERVLVVEDEALVALTMEAALEDAGFEVVDTVVSGQAAIDACDARKPAVVLMDINLKGPMDGIEAARLVRERCGVQVVFVTGQGDAATRERAMAGGPAGYLRKPFTPEALVATVRAAPAAAGRGGSGLTARTKLEHKSISDRRATQIGCRAILFLKGLRPWPAA